MSTTPVQNYEHHAKVPTTLFRPFVAYLLGLIAAFASLFLRSSAAGVYLSGIGLLLIGIGGVLALVMTRQYATKLQDRIIRAEMRARLYRVLPADQHGSIESLSINQCVALRFASDAELPELTAKVLSDKITERDPIKRMVTDWQPDFERV